MHQLGLPLQPARRLIRLVLPLAMLLSLAGCWTGDPWFAASEAVAVIPDGRYRLVEARAAEQGAAPMDDGERTTITRQPDGSLLLGGGDKAWRAVIVPLAPGEKGRFIVQLQEQDEDHPRHALFVLLDTRGGHYRIAVLACGQAAAAAARGGGGNVSRDPSAGSSCNFSDRATMTAQFRRAVREGGAAFDTELLLTRD